MGRKLMKQSRGDVGQPSDRGLDGSIDSRRPGAEREALPEADSATFSPENFHAHGDGLERATMLLFAAHVRRERGVNVLLHGPDAVGKGEFARLLTAGCGLKLRVAGAAVANGELSSASERLASLRLGHRLYANGDTLLLFERLEGLLEAGVSGKDSEAITPPELLARLLETNEVPTIWTAKTIESIDPLLISCFSLSVEFCEDGASQRAHVLQRHLGSWVMSTLFEEDVAAVAQRFVATSAQFRTAVEDARLIKYRVDRPTLEKVLARILNSSANA